VVLVIWFLLILVVIAVLLDMLSRRLGRAEASSYQMVVELHRIRRRMEVAQLKHHIRGSAARARRELRDELEGRGRKW
jgi:beta-lactamase regulating signal transducer with metallopeptidase domain